MLTKTQLLEPLAACRGSAVVVTTMGVVRPWAEYSGSELDFASADSAMGHAADLAVGIALAQPARRVICLNGDGSMLMSLGTLVTAVQARVANLVLFVVRNNSYEITGNQPVPGAGFVDFAAMARGAGFSRVYSFSEPASYADQLPEILSGEGPVFVEVAVQPGVEPPLSRGDREKYSYLKPSIAGAAHGLRRVLQPFRPV
jgi:thiamine pyrophosphate-dependent acetolactate synthase large subunit-like protein